MAGETLITVVGNLTADPELRFTPGGSAVSNFTVASTPRHFDKNTNEWKDAETLFLRCAIWREAAEYVAESLKKGMRVIVQGRLKARTYEDKAGEKRTVYELDVEEVGPSLRYASATVKRMTRQADPSGGYTNGGGNSGQAAAAGGAPVGQPAEAAGDWGGGWGSPETEPVF
jgi:single-strand DNA-binding protein